MSTCKKALNIEEVSDQEHFEFKEDSSFHTPRACTPKSDDKEPVILLNSDAKEAIESMSVSDQGLVKDKFESDFTHDPNPLGEGSFGRVYKARSIINGRISAVKVSKKQFTSVHD